MAGAQSSQKSVTKQLSPYTVSCDREYWAYVSCHCIVTLITVWCTLSLLPGTSTCARGEMLLTELSNYIVILQKCTCQSRRLNHGFHSRLPFVSNCADTTRYLTDGGLAGE